MAENFLQRLARNPYAPIDGASVTRVDELGNGYDDWNNLIAPKFEQPQQTWGETALGVATAPARMATALAGSLSPYGPDGWQLPPIIDEGVNALSAVGDAYNYGMDQDEINSRALGMAGFMMGGGGLAARPAGGTGMFAGRLAKTADQEALARAERLAAEGADRRAIWDQTGWFQGPDQKWRFEIDDSGASLARYGENLGSAWNHPALTQAYDLGDVGLYGHRGKGGSHVASEGGGYLSIGDEYKSQGRASIGLHETQHAIQRREDFARGGNPEMFSPKALREDYSNKMAQQISDTMSKDSSAAEAFRALNRYRARLVSTYGNDWGKKASEFDLDEYSALENELLKTPIGRDLFHVDATRQQMYSDWGYWLADAPHKEYERLAGEVEARNVQKRMNMSADERRATPPWETQDIPDADQIVRLYSNASKEGGLLSNILGYFQGNKEPVTVRGYHGTRSEFDKFNGPSVYASENPDAASEWAMVANRDGEAPNVLPLDITASNPYYAKSLFPDQAELDRIAAADPDVVFYPPSTQHGTTFDKYPGRVFEARKPGTVRSATTGETLFSNASKEAGSLPALLGAGQEQDIPDWLLPYLR